MTHPTAPDADERRIQHLLRAHGVGLNALPPPTLPPKPTGRPRDWLDDILDTAPPAPEAGEPAPESRAWWSHKRPRVKTDGVPRSEETGGPEGSEGEEEQQVRARAFAPQPDYWPRPHMPATFAAVPERAAAAISPGTRRLLYNASAAGAGWALGLYHEFAGALADCGTRYSISGALVLGAGGTALIAHLWDRYTRHWWPGIAWCARIPLATAVLALALWAPAAT